MLLDDRGDELAGIERSRVQGELPRLDPGQVEDLVDQAEQVAPAPLDPPERLRLGLVQRPVDTREQRVREAQDRVHRRPQLVTDTRQEPRLGLARARQRGVGLRESLRQHPLALEGVLEPLARAVQVPRQLPELVAVRHLHPLPEVARAHLRQRPLHLLDRQEEGPGQQEAHQQGDQDAHRREGEDDGEEQRRGPRRSCRAASLISSLGQRDEGLSEGAASIVGARLVAADQHVLEDVGFLVFSLQVQTLGLIDRSASLNASTTSSLAAS